MKPGPFRRPLSIFVSTDAPEGIWLHPGFDSDEDRVLHSKGPSRGSSHAGSGGSSEGQRHDKPRVCPPLPLLAAGCPKKQRGWGFVWLPLESLSLRRQAWASSRSWLVRQPRHSGNREASAILFKAPSQMKM